jgi:uncharacterized protein involved in oxidation of intracellular sulfur
VKTLLVLNDPAYGTERFYPERLLQPRRLLGAAIRDGAEVGLCGTCMDARAVHDEQLVAGARRSGLEELTDWTIWADKVISF